MTTEFFLESDKEEEIEYLQTFNLRCDRILNNMDNIDERIDSVQGNIDSIQCNIDSVKDNIHSIQDTIEYFCKKIDVFLNSQKNKINRFIMSLQPSSALPVTQIFHGNTLYYLNSKEDPKRIKTIDNSFTITAKDDLSIQGFYIYRNVLYIFIYNDYLVQCYNMDNQSFEEDNFGLDKDMKLSSLSFLNDHVAIGTEWKDIQIFNLVTRKVDYVYKRSDKLPSKNSQKWPESDYYGLVYTEHGLFYQAFGKAFYQAPNPEVEPIRLDLKYTSGWYIPPIIVGSDRAIYSGEDDRIVMINYKTNEIVFVHTLQSSLENAKKRFHMQFSYVACMKYAHPYLYVASKTYVENDSDRFIEIIDVEKHGLVKSRRLYHDQVITDMLIVKDGTIYSASKDKTVAFFDKEKGELVNVPVQGVPIYLFEKEDKTVWVFDNECNVTKIN